MVLDGKDPKWAALVSLLNNNLGLESLRLDIDLRRDYDDALWTENENDTRYLFDVYRGVLSELCRLKGLKAVQIDLRWFRDLESPVEQEIMGAGFSCPDEKIRSQRQKKGFWREWEIPQHWIRDCHLCKELGLDPKP